MPNSLKFWYCAVFFVSLCTQACKSDKTASTEAAVAEPVTDPGATFAATLNGKPLHEIPEPDTLASKFKQELTEARSYYLGNLGNVKGYADYGKKALKLGYVENAVQVLSKGVDQFPNTADLYLYRGIALVTGRQFQEAVNDFWKAGKAIEGQRDAKSMLGVEPGEEKLDITMQYDIYRWMGLAFQCQGDFSNAEKMYEVCGDFATNSDLYCMAYYWQYQAYMRAGRQQDATSILQNVSPKMYISEPTKPYLEALLYFKGELQESALVNLDQPPVSSIEARAWTIKAYAIAVQSQINQHESKFITTLDKILAIPYWNQPAYIAAEADHHQIKGFNYEKMNEVKVESNNKRKEN